MLDAGTTKWKWNIVLGRESKLSRVYKAQMKIVPLVALLVEEENLNGLRIWLLRMEWSLKRYEVEAYDDIYDKGREASAVVLFRG